MNTGKYNKYTALFVFMAVLGVYLLTVAPTISFWDSAEFITSAHTMGIPHSPGSPLLSLAGRVISIMPFYDFRGGGFDHPAYRMNLISVFAGAFTALLMYLIAVNLITRFSPFRKERWHDGMVMFSAAVSAFMAAFSHQFWENAIETETYMPSLLITMLAIWLSLRWAERKDNPGSVRLLFLVAYLIGLGNGIHLYVMLVAPVVALIVIFEKPSWFKSSQLWMVFIPAMVAILAVRLIGGREVLYGVMALFAVASPFFLLRRYRTEQTRGWKFTLLGLLLCVSLYVVGYSVYPTIMVRASKSPSINEGNPDTWARYSDYLDRKQYGQGNMYAGMLDRKADTGYQFGYMYVRYLFQQFPKWGPSPKVIFSNNRVPENPLLETPIQNEVPVSILIWLILLLGFYWHMRHDIKGFAPMLIYFLMTSIGLILYLNMENPQARERDYFFLGSFHIIMVWLAIGIFRTLTLAQELLGKLSDRRLVTPLLLGVVILLATLVPAAVFSNHIDENFSNYRLHDRSRNFIPYEYGINLLKSCEPNAILFTYGDNDTYPVWFAQEVEGFRTDVRVVNISILRGPWYIKQLRDEGAVIPIDMTDDFIDRKLCGDTLLSQRTLLWSETPKDVTIAGITWAMPPSYILPGTGGKKFGFLSVSSYMIAHIIQKVKWTRPIYFAVSTPAEMMIGLGEYRTMEGMVFRLNNAKIASSGPYRVNASQLYENIFTKYSYSGVKDLTLYKTPETMQMLKNYTSSFVDLCDALIREGDITNAVRAAQGAFEFTAPDLDRRAVLATILRDGNITEEYEKIIDAEIAKMPLDNEEASMAIATRYLQFMLNEGSGRMFRAIIDRNPESIGSWKGYAATLYQDGKLKESLAVVDTLLSIAPLDVEAQQIRDVIMGELQSDRGGE